MSEPTSIEGPTLGVIVCARDEAAVIERRLGNLALSHWPPSDRPHQVLVVDDGSSDATAKLAAAWMREVRIPGVQFELVTNRERPGKSGAIQAGLGRLGNRADVIVLTDADVVNVPEALEQLVLAFSATHDVGMVCGSQAFVSQLPADGAIDPKRPGNVAGPYDRATAWVRALESRFGRVFSVHGQLLAWRADLALVPKASLAADDLDLMRQVRLAGKRVVLAARARFFERKPGRELMRQAQAVRRARAYVQFAATLDPEAAPDALTRWQWRFYKHVPTSLPILVGPISVAICGPCALLFLLDPESVRIFLWPTLIALGFMTTAVWPKANVIAEARRLERVQSMDDRWLTAR